MTGLADMIRKAGLAGTEVTPPRPKPGTRMGGANLESRAPAADLPVCRERFQIKHPYTGGEFTRNPRIADPATGKHTCTLVEGHSDVHECNHGHQS